MSDTREPHSVIEAAEQAAAAGNYVHAEALLREAALLQEASLGPLHPDLATTLNNLGIMCETNGNPDAAEQCFRRAVSIATKVLEPDHPFVSTSRKNLHDFCEARGKPIDPTPLPVVVPTPEPPPTFSVEPSDESRLPIEPQDVQPPGRTRSIRLFAFVALGVAAIALVIFASARPWLASTEPAISSSPTAVDSPREISEQPPPSAVSVEKPPSPAKPAESARNQVRSSQATIPSTNEQPVVVTALLCSALNEWRCDAAASPVAAGPLFFYTQLKSERPITIQHRWYRDNRLLQSVELRVEANPGAGFRTYSRNTMNNTSAGSWRVELRSEDGALLHEERFTVR